MQNDSNTESVDIQVIYFVFLIVSDDLRSHITRSSTLGEDDSGFVVKGCQTVIDDFESMLGPVLIK